MGSEPMFMHYGVLPQQGPMQLPGLMEEVNWYRHFTVDRGISSLV